MEENLINPILETNVKLSAYSFIISIVLSYILSYILSKIYISQANSLSNHESLAKIFPLLSVTTTIVIAVVKSSLALSLGLVGALSIVRFRTPIKEPEELTYIFLAIAIGLANGADQYLASCIGLLLASLSIVLNNKFFKRVKSKNSLRLSIQDIRESDYFKVIEILTENCKQISFDNFVINDGSYLMTLTIKPKSFEDIQKLMNRLNNNFPEASISIMDIKNF